MQINALNLAPLKSSLAVFFLIFLLLALGSEHPCAVVYIGGRTIYTGPVVNPGRMALIYGTVLYPDIAVLKRAILRRMFLI